MSLAVVCRRAVLALAVVLVAGAAVAQSTDTFAFVANKAFTAGKQVLPPGRYSVQFDGSNGFVLKGSGKEVRVSVITRLARTLPANADARFVFDALDNGDQLLSEIWLPGEDGYLVCTMEKAHHHVMLEGRK